MLDPFDFFVWRLKVAARIHEHREWLRCKMPSHRCILIAEHNDSFEQAMQEGYEEGAAAAHAELIKIEVRPPLFGKAGMK